MPAVSYCLLACLLNNPKLAQNVRKRLNKENETEPEPLNTGQPSGTDPAFYPMSTGGSFSGMKRSGVKLRYNGYSYHSYVRGVSAGYGLDSQGWIPGRGKNFSLLHKVQTCSGSHPASYPVSTGGSFSGGKNLCKF
jgi:hypothetical protein